MFLENLRSEEIHNWMYPLFISTIKYFDVFTYFIFMRHQRYDLILIFERISKLEYSNLQVKVFN